MPPTETSATPKPTVLFVDDDVNLQQAMGRFLSREGFEVTICGSVSEAMTRFYTLRPEVVLLDLHLGDGTALDLIGPWHTAQPDTPIVMLTGDSEIDQVVATIKAGAEQFLVKPVDLPLLSQLLQRLIDRGRRRRVAEAASRQHEIDPFVGDSEAIRTLAHQASLVARGTAPVLITGETGSGKGVLAKWIHRNGPCAQYACVDLNCAGLSRELLESELFGHARGAFTGAVAEKKGLLEVADRGTVVLDEIGDLDTAIQPKLLKALEEKVFRRLGEVRERTVSFRLIAATNRDLREGLANGTFREDLYYRVSTFPIEIPPLRSRPEDIGPLAERILADQERERGVHARLSAGALERLQSYQWPGNIRELRNVLDRATLYCRPRGEITAEHLFLEPSRKAAAGPASGVPEPLEEVIRKHIIATLAYERGDVVRAASRLGIPRSTLYQRINQLGLDPSEYR